jgi:hypothetical protein
MSTRTSIELDDDTCRLVDVHLPGRAGVTEADARVRAFAVDLPGAREPQALEAALGHLRRTRKLSRDACVTMWGTGSIHRVLRLRDADSAGLEAAALAECAEDIAALDRQGKPAWVTVIPGDSLDVDGSPRRPVALVALSGGEARRRLAPILAAGFRVTRCVTPALALAALAHRHDEAVSGAAVCAVALGRRASCVTVVGGGTVLVGHELAWGHADMDGEALERRIARELGRWIGYFADRPLWRVERVVLCGDMPGLRRLTTALERTLGVSVQPLDSLAGIDMHCIPEPSDVFRREVSALRLSIAATASDSVNLIPGRRRRPAMPAVGVFSAAAVALFVVGGWLLLRPEPDAAPRPFPGSRAQAAAGARDSVSAPPDASPQIAAPLPPPPASSLQPSGTARLDAGSAAALSGAPPEIASERARVTSILYSRQRQLAIVNGRVVRPGDRVGASVVYQIQPRAVVMEGADGRRWTIPLRPRDEP